MFRIGVYINLTQGKYTLIDREDYEIVNKYKWRLNKNNYAFTSLKRVGSYRPGLYLHRYLLSPPEEFVVDHINGDGLDNTRANLRVCTIAENTMNRTKKSTSSSGYRGISWHKKTKKWAVQLNAYKRKFNIGHFTDIKDAINAYNQAVSRYQKQFGSIHSI